MATGTPLSTKVICGCSYEQLIKREKASYCLHEPWLISVIGLSYEEATEILQTQIERLLDDINTKMTPDYRVKHFTIGKSYVKRRSRPSGGFLEFKDLKPNTWKVLGGVNKRWEDFYKREKYDGLIVLCVTPRNSIPDLPRIMAIGPQEYACALEQRLIQNFHFIKMDVRLNNKSLEPGGKAKDPYAGLIYFAYKLQDLKGGKQTDIDPKHGDLKPVVPIGAKPTEKGSNDDKQRDEGENDEEQTNNEQIHETQQEEKPKKEKPNDKEPIEEKHHNIELKEENDKQTSKDEVQTDGESTTNNTEKANEENKEVPKEEYKHGEDNKQTAEKPDEE